MLPTTTRVRLLVGLIAAVAAFGAWQLIGIVGLGGPAVESQWATIERYCIDCHNAAEFAGGIAFDGLGEDRIAAHPEVFEAAIRKLDAGLMPPPGEPRPPASELAGLSGWFADTLDAAARDDPKPGAPALHRLNRAEYANAVRDLLDLELDVAMLLPGDDSSAGFDNIASALVVSPSLMQAYVTAAAKISRLAVGDMTTSPGITTYTLPRELSQAGHLEGMPLGTRGGLRVEHVFPLDARYEIEVRRGRGGFGLPTVGADEPIEVSLNGERIELIADGDAPRLVIDVPAGPQTLAVANVAQARPRGVDDLYATWAESPGIGSVSITGPLDATGPGDTPSRRRIFDCAPSAEDRGEACARRILRRLATHAYRRPVDDDSLDTLMEFYESGRALRGFETGVQYALARILVDAQFVFRFEREPEGLADGATMYELGPYELASRLSFFLWSSLPDESLLEAAGNSELADPAGREAQVRRMLADPKAEALVDNFAAQWLLLRELDTVNPATNEFDGNLRRAFRRETSLLFESILREDASIVDLLDADYTFVDERLARHYGIEHVRGSRYRRVALDGPRRGLLGHGSILTATSPPNRTSPVTRGAWILENVLGTPAPVPPPGVDTDLDATAAPDDSAATVRQRLERHRADPDCAACHALIDPLGFALENFDHVGRWRDEEAGRPVDATGRLWDGTVLVGPDGLRAALVERRDLFVSEVTAKLMTYALGRPVVAEDMPAVRAVVRGAEAQDYSLSSLVLGIVESLPFRFRARASGMPTEPE